MIEDILKVIEETFEECISVNAFETITGIETEIEGKEEFMEFLKKRITESVYKPKFPYSVRILNEVLSKEQRTLENWKERSKTTDVPMQHIDNGEHRINELINAISRLKPKKKE